MLMLFCMQDHDVRLFHPIRVQAASAILRVHESDPAELLESGGQQEVEEEVKELESLQNS